VNVPENALRTVSSPTIEREDLFLKRHDHDHGHVTVTRRFRLKTKDLLYHDDMVTRDAGAGRFQTIKKNISKSNIKFSSHHFGPFLDK
jgi:hypothetical protein